ncbi:14479_t:CDS:2 [Racocetra fulgida]|uniref:14478_t:CDS:1 n=1 Tax=Racocetra fulgida TaxID=60492 RepID=A0A9N9BJ67_9GLOM|nr:14478_t:CDS:2 [Racocetra fulgida]CAG8565570.1 14479_t:CDS:2 [Racocetra fulgida]
MNSNEDMKDIQEKKYILMTLKEEWEKTEKNLAARKSLTIAHLVVSLITILTGIFLYVIAKRRDADKLLNIITSSITATGGILALVKIIGEYAMSNKENIKTLIQATRTANSDRKFKIESIELTQDQKTGLRRLMCGLELDIKRVDTINLNCKTT